MEQKKDLKKRKMLMMTSGAAVIFFTGFPHVWSVYQPYMMEEAGWSRGQASVCFYLAFAAFVVGNIVGGRMQDTRNPRRVLWYGGYILSMGILFSAFMIVPSPVFFYITYGVMQGFGQGMVYATIITAARKWFLDRPGFASGIIVTANGFCGVFMAPISRRLLLSGGPKQTLIYIGLAIAMTWLASVIFFAMPETSGEDTGEEKKASGQKQFTSLEMVHTKKSYPLLFTMLFGLISYFLISSGCSMRIVFCTGIVFAAFAFICLAFLEREH